MSCQEFVVFSPPTHQIIVGCPTISGTLTSHEMTFIHEDKVIKAKQNLDSLSRIFRLVSGLRGSKILLFIT